MKLSNKNGDTARPALNKHHDYEFDSPELSGNLQIQSVMAGHNGGFAVIFPYSGNQDRDTMHNRTDTPTTTLERESRITY